MKIERTRASRKAARRYNVSPVARAVRSVLTISAAALMFSGTGVVLAKSPVVAPLPVERASLSHEFAKVVDLTRVADAWTPKNVVDEEFQSFASPMGVAESFAPDATVEGFGVVDDPTILPGSFHPGPGGVSGTDDQVFVNLDLSSYGPVSWQMFDGFVPPAVVSTDGMAVGAFFRSDSTFVLSNYWDGLSVTGTTWAAGIEAESLGGVGVGNYDTIVSTVTGADGVAFGVYANGETSAVIYNNGTLYVNGDGAGAEAFGMYAFSASGVAATNNFADLYVSADGDAVGSSAVSLGANAWNANSGTMVVSGNRNAQGMYAASLYGDAFGQNTGTMSVSGYSATGIYAFSVYGNANADNFGALDVTGAYAQGAWARSLYGNAEASNSATGVVNVDGYYGAAGLIANADYGTATVTNAGTVNVISAAGVARGAFAYGDVAVVNNSGSITTGAGLHAIGIDAEGFRGTTVTNSGTIVAGSSGDAIGVWATSSGDTDVVNTASGNIDVDAVNGIAYGIYAGGYDAYVRNWATVDVASTYGDAIGIGVAGVYAFAENDGLINANGGSRGFGMFGFGVASVDLVNGGTINASASATNGFAAGMLAVGDVAGAYNSGTIYANGAAATGIDVRATSDGMAQNVNTINVSGGDVTGISVNANGVGGTANALNYGAIDARGDLFAAGVVAVARGYLGTASVYNAYGTTVTASAKYGTAQGIVASADMDASVDNQGVLHTYGGDGAYGILALSADGDVTVDNGGEIVTVAQNRGYAIAYGIAAQSNNGLVSVTNDGMMLTVGEYSSIGIYASTKWNDAEVVNNGQIGALALANEAKGAVAISYTGTASVTNGEFGRVQVQGAYAAAGLQAVSVYDLANITNDGDVVTMGGVLDRGLLARSTKGGTATITNNGTVSTNGGYSSYGVWARSDFGDATVNNTGAIESYSEYGVAYGVLAGGRYTIAVDNSGDIRAYAGDTAAGVLAYSLAGDATVTNSNYILGASGNAAYGAQVIANNGTASLTNDVGGTIVASGYNIADAVFASGATVNVTNNGTLTADADGWAAGIEAVGGDVTLVSNTGADISAYALAGRANGMVAQADGDATVRNGGTIDVDSYSGDAFGTFAQAGGNAVMTNGGALSATSMQGDAFGMVGIGYNADLSQSATITVSGNGTAIGMAGDGYAHANIVNNGDVIVTANSGFAAGLSTYSVHDTRQVNNGTIDVHATSGSVYGMTAFGFDDTELVNLAGSSIDASVDSGTAYGMFGYGGLTTLLTNDGAITATSGNGNAYGMFGAGAQTSVEVGETGSVVARGSNAYGIVALSDATDIRTDGAISAYGNGNAIAVEGVGYAGGGTVSIHAGGTLYASAGSKYGMAAGIVAVGDGDVDVHAASLIEAHGTRYSYGVMAHSDSGSVFVGNDGAIGSYASFINGHAFGIDASGYTGAAVANAGAIVAEGKYATGISVDSEGGIVGANNSGTVEVDALVAQGIGIIATTNTGSVALGNSGTVDVEGLGPDSMVFGVIAGSDAGGATINNLEGGHVYASTEYGVAGGLYGFGPTVTINNNAGALVEVTGGTAAVGIGFDATNATISNGGTITVTQLGVDATQPPPLTVTEGNAIGIAGYVAQGGSAIVTNDGSIDVTANDAAFGIQVGGYGDVTVDGIGSITANALYGNATGIDVRAFDDYAPTHVAITTGGALDVASVNGAATGINAVGTDIAIHHDGTTNVTANTFAVGIQATGNTLLADNTGDITVRSIGADGPAVGIAGFFTEGGSASVTNDGAIDVGTNGRAFGIQVGGYGNIVVDGTGSITAHAVNGDATGIDVRAYDDLGTTQASITTGGALEVTSDLGMGTGLQAFGTDAEIHNGGTTHVSGATFAAGIRAMGDDIFAGNTGEITALATGATGDAVGIAAYATQAAGIDNQGDVAAQTQGGIARGVFAYSELGDAIVDSAGAVTATSDAIAMGIFAIGYGVDIHNTGTIAATGGTLASGIGASIAEGHLGTVTNDGAIAVDAHYAFGIQMRGYGDVVVDGTGSIYAHATGEDATAAGIVATTLLQGTQVSIGTGAELNVFGEGNAQGVYAYGGQVHISNTGLTHVQSGLRATGLFGEGDTVLIDNIGSLNVESATGNATGILANGFALASIESAGDVAVSVGGTNAHAWGLYARGGAEGAIVHGGTLDVEAIGDSTYATGLFAVGQAATVDNTGDVSVTADRVTAAGVSGTSAAFHNTGHITALSDSTQAIGVRVDGTVAGFDNGGTISAHAGEGAYGAIVVGYDTASLVNGGDITAVSDGTGGQAIGLGAYARYDLAASNTGDIYAIAYQGAAVGASAQSYGGGNVHFANSGSIAAHAAGETIGLRVAGDVDADIVNSGLIAAVHQDNAVALSLDVLGNATVNNTGEILAQGSEEGSIAIQGGDGFDLVTNGGDILGALVTGAGDDRLTNAAGGTWTVRGHATDFGDGDDAIVNAGTIVLHDAAISLGGNSAAGNSFANNGMLSIDGDSAIDMGTGATAALATANAQIGNAPAVNAPAAVLNPLAFTNNGTISFLDGAPDDMLTITGDFAGQGALNVDVSLLHGASDMLYVDGNIASSAVQTLNVNVLDLMGTNSIDIPVVVVEGDAVEGNVQAGTIVAGNVNFNANNFLDLRVAVTPKRDASNAINMFSLTLAFGGLNDTGSLATAIAPGAQSLMAAQVGTFRQRMGVFSQLGDSDKGAWVRVFGDKGSITPDAQLDNLPVTNNFAFDQTNQGVEAGLNALVTDGFFVGVSLSKSRGKQDLANGFGSDDIDGTTIGGYVTWLGQNGIYADVSYRWMHFDADMTSFGGQREVGGDAGAFNAELGWNVWASAGGMKLVPQVQYTRTKVENIDRIEGDLADFVSDGGTSSRARLGLEMEQTFQSASGTKWTPYGVLSVVREFDGESGFTVADTFTGRTSTEGTSGQVEFGVNAKIGQRVDVWGGLNYMDGGAIDGVWGGQLGIRYTW